MDKICTKCKITKPLSEFHKKSTKPLLYKSICKQCAKEYKKEYYLLNKNKITKQVRLYNKKVLEVSCKFCSNKYFAVERDYNKGRYQYCSRSCSTKDRNNPLPHIITDLKKRADRKSLEFNLTSKYLEELLIQQNFKCAVVGCDICIKRFSEETILYKTASLDRIDNAKGYVEGNVQWVVLGINYMKNKFTNKDLLILIDLIKNN